MKQWRPLWIVALYNLSTEKVDNFKKQASCFYKLIELSGHQCLGGDAVTMVDS